MGTPVLRDWQDEQETAKEITKQKENQWSVGSQKPNEESASGKTE